MIHIKRMEPDTQNNLPSYNYKVLITIVIFIVNIIIFTSIPELAT